MVDDIRDWTFCWDFLLGLFVGTFVSFACSVSLIMEQAVKLRQALWHPRWADTVAVGSMSLAVLYLMGYLDLFCAWGCISTIIHIHLHLLIRNGNIAQELACRILVLVHVFNDIFDPSVYDCVHGSGQVGDCSDNLSQSWLLDHWSDHKLWLLVD
jgi:hypothetical protein